MVRGIVGDGRRWVGELKQTPPPVLERLLDKGSLAELTWKERDARSVCCVAVLGVGIQALASDHPKGPSSGRSGRDGRTNAKSPASSAHLSFGGVSHGRSSGKVVGGGEEGKGTLHIDGYRGDCIVESTFGNFVQVVLSQQWRVAPNLTGKRRYQYTLCVVRTPYVRTPNAPRPTPTRP